jgi:protein-L-isoaspartate(D-aspartate) O-methyltransferase
MTELLDPGPADKVLEIGTGTGYQTAILARLAAHVYTIEWHLKLLTEATERLRELGVVNVSLRCSDGSHGWPEKAPFDGIMVTAGAPHVPAALREQLAVGGRMIIPVGPADDQELLCIRRRGGAFEQAAVLRCRFVKLRGEDGWRE